MSHNTCLLEDGKRGFTVFAAAQHPKVFVLKERNVLDQQKQIIELYDEVRPSLHSYLCSLGVTAGEAEDVIQEAFFRLVRYLASDHKVDNFRGWLFRVAYNLSMDVHRELGRDQTAVYDDSELPVWEQVDPALNPEQRYLHEEKMKRLSSAIHKLTPKQRHCILLRAEGMRYQDIGVVLGITTQRAAILVQRGLTRLADLCD